jgi:hypothetical protein
VLGAQFTHNITTSLYHELSIDIVVDKNLIAASHSKYPLNFDLQGKMRGRHITFNNFSISENNHDNIVHLTPNMNMSVEGFTLL